MKDLRVLMRPRHRQSLCELQQLHPDSRTGVGMMTLTTRRRDGTAVQVVFALTLAVIVGVALWWGFLRENAPTRAAGIRVQADFTAMPDGPAPDYFDGGQPMTTVVSPTPRRPTQNSARWVDLPTHNARDRNRVLEFARPRFVGKGYGCAVCLPARIRYAWRNRPYGIARHQATAFHR